MNIWAPGVRPLCRGNKQLNDSTIKQFNNEKQSANGGGGGFQTRPGAAA
jgi:hypothetical protein